MTFFVANFEDGSSDGFRPVNLASSVSPPNILQNGPAGNAQSGTRFLRTFTKQSGGSVAVDFTFFNGGPGSENFFVSAFAWVRSLDGPLDGLMTLWGDLNPANNNHPDVPFRAEKHWKFLNNAVPVTIGGNLFGSSKTIRLEFYMETTETALDIDSVVLV
jgi:hypothetical protein